MSFESFDLHPKIGDEINRLGYTAPTPIQSQAIPLLLDGRDLIGLAPTGTGKTAAFVLPILNRLAKVSSPGLRALIIVPTRELAEQVHDVVRELGAGLRVRSTVVYGGVNFERQVRDLRRGATLVVACPGRLLDHVRQRTIDLSRVETLVLDEADRMFDMGFLPDIRAIVRAVPKERQTVLLSATMPDDIRALAHDILSSPETIQVAPLAPVESVSQSLYPMVSEKKTPLLLHLLKDIPREESVLIFTRTKHRAKRLDATLREAGFRATSLQGNLSQSRRKSAMEGFRSGSYQIMVATDIASRGLDVSQIFHVFNYDMPDTVDAYTHRIGRTGRASRTGASYTFVTHEDVAEVRATERVLKKPIPRQYLDGFNEPRDGAPFEASAGGGGGQRPAGRGRNFRGRRNNFRGGQRSGSVN